MRVPFRQSRQLRGIERRLRRSEPHLVAMLAIFARLYAGEAVISREQALPAGHRARRALAVLAGTVAALAAGLAAAGSRACRRAASTCAAVRRRFDRTTGVPLSTSSAAPDPRDPGR